MRDAQDVMGMLVKVQNEQGEMELDDPRVNRKRKLTTIFLNFPSVQVSYMISSWARMCKIIGAGFVQYLPVVMGPLIQAADLQPEVVFLYCELMAGYFTY